MNVRLRCGVTTWILVMSLSITACGGSEQKYLGEWVDIQSSDSFVNVSKDGDALIREDNEGKYPARMEDGQLKVSSGLGDILVQHVGSTDHLIAAGHEFKRKGL